MSGAALMRSGEPCTVELRIPAQPENLSLARLALAGVGSIAGAPDDVVADLKVAVTEACTNAIQHAYSEGGDGAVIVRYRIGDALLEVEIVDAGTGFDPSDPAAGNENSGGQGMGLMIIRELTDDVVIESDGNGSRIFFQKRLQSI
ncbi:MAG TPA: ATP-binding protein [Gaiellaceae bacterium]|jgi:serine/threonine-protein kinase RsbW